MSEEKKKEKKETEWGERDSNLQEASTFENEKEKIKWGEKEKRDPRFSQKVSKRTRDGKDE